MINLKAKLQRLTRHSSGANKAFFELLSKITGEMKRKAAEGDSEAAFYHPEYYISGMIGEYVCKNNLSAYDTVHRIARYYRKRALEVSFDSKKLHLVISWKE